MNSTEEVDPLSFVFIVISSVGFLLGIITILFFMTNAFYNFCCWFFAISLISQFLCLYSCYEDSEKHPTRPLIFNPYFHNAISFFTFAVTWTTSILYIIDTVILHLSTLVQFMPKCDIKTSINKFINSKSVISFSSTIEILVLPELLIWLLIKHNFGVLITIIVYIFNILMFGYSCFDPCTRKFQSIYRSLRKQYSNSDGPYKSLLKFLLSVCDYLSSISNQIYKVSLKNILSN